MVAANVFPIPVVLRGDHNVLWQTFIKWLRLRIDFNGAKVSVAANQAIATATVTAVTWDSPADYDTSVFYAAGQPTRLTAPAAGTYSVAMAAQFDVNAVGIRVFAITHNGTIVAAMNDIGNAAWYVGGVVTADVPMAAGDYVEAVVYQSSGGNLNIVNIYPITFSIHRIGR